VTSVVNNTMAQISMELLYARLMFRYYDFASFIRKFEMTYFNCSSFRRNFSALDFLLLDISLSFLRFDLFLYQVTADY